MLTFTVIRMRGYQVTVGVTRDCDYLRQKGNLIGVTGDISWGH